MFHIAESSSRDYIDEHGLTPNKRESGSNKPTFGEFARTGVYVSEEPHAVKGVDVYAVDTSHLPALIDDKTAMDRAKRSRFIPGSVPKERVRRLNDTEINTLYESSNMARWKNPLGEQRTYEN